MKKTLHILILLVLTLSVSLLAAIPVMADTSSLLVTSDDSVEIIGIYNKAGGPTNYVDFTVSPMNAVFAAEPDPCPTDYPSEPPETEDSTWDEGTGNYFYQYYPTADWIWETERAEDPVEYGPGHALYDDNASSNGRVVVFQKTFTVSGSPEYATLHIAADNCYEVWINVDPVGRSATAKVDDWEISDLHEGSVASNGWQTVGHYPNLAKYLVEGTNTITITVGNEYYPLVEESGEENNTPPPYMADPYSQKNPAALIFALDIQSTLPPVPELPAGALLGLGLAGIGAFIVIKHKRQAIVRY
ncbi:MAG: hypothetical protein JXA46_17100 [Dehalococcoidales bacterium]|nr:hypothetical protein [Dehalococcoidales bacterium]